MIHHKTTYENNVSHLGPLSIKTVRHGSEYYELNGGRYEVRPDNYLIVNHGQEYTSYVDSPEPVDLFTIFLSSGMAEDVLTSLVTPDDQLLDDPDLSSDLPVTFFERLYPSDDLVQPHLRYMQRMTLTGGVSTGWQEEQTRFLLERLLAVHRNVRREVSRLPATRHTTRVELYRRLYRARDFMYSTINEQIRLEDIASVACLSRYHFIRSFKSLFGKTPYQFLAECRIERARQLLETTERSITDISFDIGFQSLGSFCWTFKERYGHSPLQYRKLSIDNRNNASDMNIN